MSIQFKDNQKRPRKVLHSVLPHNDAALKMTCEAMGVEYNPVGVVSVEHMKPTTADDIISPDAFDAMLGLLKAPAKPDSFAVLRQLKKLGCSMLVHHSAGNKIMVKKGSALHGN